MYTKSFFFLYTIYIHICMYVCILYIYILKSILVITFYLTNHHSCNNKKENIGMNNVYYVHAKRENFFFICFVLVFKNEKYR